MAISKKSEIPERKLLRRLFCDVFSGALLNHHERCAAAPAPSVVIVSLMFFFEVSLSSGSRGVLKFARGAAEIRIAWEIPSKPWQLWWMQNGSIILSLISKSLWAVSQVNLHLFVTFLCFDWGSYHFAINCHLAFCARLSPEAEHKPTYMWILWPLNCAVKINWRVNYWCKYSTRRWFKATLTFTHYAN